VPTTTERLRLEPVQPSHTGDLWTLHQDPVVAQWFAGTWSLAEAERTATSMADAWARDGVSKWMAYSLATGALVGRGGLSRMAADASVTLAIANIVGESWLADRLELGWSLLSAHHGQGYATEIGAAGLRYGFSDLGADRVVSFTERHNTASRAVMERLGMRYAGEIASPGLIEGRDGVHDDAPFALYVTDRRR
jgi:RimJ/RimL family protein N-acetyltransferase